MFWDLHFFEDNMREWWKLEESSCNVLNIFTLHFPLEFYFTFMLPCIVIEFF